MNADAKSILAGELERRRREQETLLRERSDHDPLTFYNAHPIDDYTDHRGMKYRLGPSKTQLECLMDTSTYRILEGGNR